MSGNPLVRFDEGIVGRTAGCRLRSYSTEKVVVSRCQPELVLAKTLSRKGNHLKEVILGTGYT